MSSIQDLETKFYLSRTSYFIIFLLLIGMFSALYAIYVNPVVAIMFFLASYIITPLLITGYYKDRYDYDVVMEMSGFTMGYAHLFTSIIFILVSIALASLPIILISFLWFIVGYSVSIFVGISLSALLMR